MAACMTASSAAERTRTSTGWLLEPPTLPLVYSGASKMVAAAGVAPAWSDMSHPSGTDPHRKECRREDSNLHYVASETTDSSVGLQRREQDGCGGWSCTSMVGRMKPD